MKLTRLQYKALRIYCRYRLNGFSIAQVLRSCWRQWLLMLAVALLVYFFIVPMVPFIGWLYIGVCAGAFFRDIGYYQVARRIWPVTQQIIDWDRVSKLVESHEKSGAGQDAVPNP